VTRYPIRSRRAGFSLVELLVVTSILALLVSIIAPSLGRAQEMTRRATCMAGIKVICNAFDMYGVEEKRWLPSAPPTLDESTSIWTVWKSGAGYYGPGHMVKKGLISDVRALYCPSWDLWTYDFGGPSGWPKNNIPGSQSIIGYSYHYRASFDASEMDMVSGDPTYRSANADNDSSDEVILCDGFTMLEGKPGVKYHHQDGYNIVRLDGSGKYLHDKQYVISDKVQSDGFGETSWAQFESVVWDGYFKDGIPGG